MTIRSFENHTPKIGNTVLVDSTALVLGEVSIGDDSSIWPMVVVRGDVHSISIGNRTNIQDGCVLHVTHASNYVSEGHKLTIGDDVTIGHKAIIHGCTIEDECLIGMGVTIMDGAVVHSQVIVGANSLVPPGKILQGGFLWVGSPVKKSRALTENEKTFLKYSASNYVKLKDRHLGSCN